MLAVENLSVRFHRLGGDQRPAVDDVTLRIAQGESLGLVGESGSGKSVTSLAIMGLLPEQAQATGKIQFAGTDLLHLSREEMRAIRGQRLAMIFQEPMTALNPVMRVGNQIAEAVLAHGKVSRSEARDRAVEALREVAISQPERRARDYPHQLSGGMRQRVMIAMALVNRPQLLIADEPTTALDVSVQAQILDLLAGLRSKFELSMLFISHDLAVVSRVADRVAVMYAGSIVEMGAAREIFHQPVHPYTQGLLKSAPTLRSDKRRPLPSMEAAMLQPLIAGRQALPSLREITPGHLARWP